MDRSGKTQGKNDSQSGICVMSVSFGELKTDHIPRIVEIENLSFAEPWSKDGFRDILVNPSFRSLGIFSDRLLAGYIFYYIVMDELHVMNIAIDPLFRKQGLGFKLLEKIHEMAKGFGVKLDYLEVRQTNEAAQKLYEKLGYKKQGRRIGYYPNQEDALLMYKDL